MKIRSALLLAVLATSFACGSRQAPTQTREARGPNASWAYVPADTPYLYAISAPVSEQPWPGSHGDGYVQMARRVHELELQGVNARKQLSETYQLAFSLLEEYGDDYEMNARAFDRLGLGAGSRLLIYGDGVDPVLRMEVARPDVLRDHVTRFLSTMDFEATRYEEEHWLFDADEFRVFLAITDSSLILAMDSHDDARWPASLFQKADNPIDHQSVFATLAKSSDDNDYVAFFKTDRLVAQIEWDPKTPACQEEAAALSSLLPAVWMAGSVEDTRMAGLVRIDLHADWAAGLMDLQVPVPRYRLKKGVEPIASFSLGLDWRKLIFHSRQLLSRVEKNPPRCPFLVGMRDGLAKLEQTLPGLAVTPFAGVGGFSGAMTEYRVDNRGELQLRGLFGLVHDDPKSLINLLQIYPNIKPPTDLQPADGAQRIHIDETAEYGPTYVAVGAKVAAIGLALKDELARVVKEPLDSKAGLGHLQAGAHFFRTLAKLYEGEYQEGDVVGVYDALLAKAILQIEEGGGLGYISGVRIDLNSVEAGLQLRFDVGLGVPARSIEE